jgi:very-short-patch-repair endonuclease
VRHLDGVPVTAPARALLDLAGLISDEVLEGCLAEAHARRLVAHRDLLDQLDRNPTRRGAARLRRALADDESPARTRSVAERKLLRLLRASSLPSPVTNARVGRYEVDFLWQKERLIVEVDGFAWHSSRRAFERDRERDADLQLAGYRVLRVTWRQLTREPDAVVERIARALAAG